MQGLAGLDLKLSYHKGEDDVAGEFYLPCMARATTYDRAVGFFSSTIYVLAWPSLRQFVEAGGTIRLVCSPVLAAADIDALHAGYDARAEEALGEEARVDLHRMLSVPHLVKPTTVLASLVAAGVIELQVAWVGTEALGRDRRLFHDKVGVFCDDEGSRVVFKGSMNETFPALSADGNIESVDVFASWRNRADAERIEGEVAYFHRLWSGVQPGVTVRPFPKVAIDELREMAKPDNWRNDVDEICRELDHAAAWSPDAGRFARPPRPHQVAALDAWTGQRRRGIFEHATGSGKTFTAMCAIRDSFAKGEVPVVLVPSELLVGQWRAGLQEAFGPDGLQLLVCGAGRSGWSGGGRLRMWTEPEAGGGAPPVPRVVLSTMQTAASPTFRAQLRAGPHIFLVADEVHRLGSPHHRSLLDTASGPRLGLSATPRRAGDPEGTAAILDYFEGVVPPPFTLQDAIAAGALTPYAYYPHRVALSADEQHAWDRLAEEIGRRIAREGGAADPATYVPSDGVKLLLIQRARIAKKAAAKTNVAVDVLRGHFQHGQRWIVYCEDQVQLRHVREALAALRLPSVFEFHSAMEGDRDASLALFDVHGGIAVAIRCLDEGVDIPSVSHALILASSRNPREFIQRRGRVLRRSEGKVLAHVHDAIVVPADPSNDVAGMSIVRGELARAIEFGSHAVNPGGIIELQRIAVEFGLVWETLTGEGYEEDDDDE
jgi:superfamily II DNA or RNA helicase